MKRSPRTTITWRFENPMAPEDKNYMPCSAVHAELVMVTITLFLGRATLTAWLNSNAEQSAPSLKYFMQAIPTGQEFRERLEAFAVIGSNNGGSLRLDMNFSCEKGEDFTHTACKKFIALCDLLGDIDYRKRFYLPYPEVSQVTMVEAYADDNWIQYGEWLWERNFAGDADRHVVDPEAREADEAIDNLLRDAFDDGSFTEPFGS